MESRISEYVEWITLDTTMESVPPPSLGRRIFLGARRLVSFLVLLLKRRPDGVMVFASAGFSFIEKGLMALMGSLFRRRVVLSPRSGLLIDNFEKSKFMRWYIPFVLGRCHVVMCQSGSWKTFYQSISGLPSRRFTVIKNWADTSPYVMRKAVSRGDYTGILFMGWIDR